VSPCLFDIAVGIGIAAEITLDFVQVFRVSMRLQAFTQAKGPADVFDGSAANVQLLMFKSYYDGFR
jgi:hypothetical protein